MLDDPATASPLSPARLDRRGFLLAGGGALAAGLLLGREAIAQKPIVHKLPPLPYPADALEPAIDKMTMEIHHGKHHDAYVTNLNKALADHPPMAAVPLVELLKDLAKVPEAIRTAVRNNGGGAHNHELFWTSMKPRGGGEPGSDLAQAITRSFGSFDRFQAFFADAAMKRFGSGWAWLVKRQGKLEVISTPNQDSPLSEGAVPLLGLDVWEHAYYLKYQNRRADYVKAWWTIVNWDEVAKRLAAAPA
jgi:Fe-Mn family superoxide dismutase